MTKNNLKYTSNIKYKTLRDLRIYTFDLPTKALYPYDYQYADIFRNLLNKNGLLCPNYDHIFIQISETNYNPFPQQKWSSNVYVPIDYKAYQSNTESQKEQIVFNSIVSGLRNLASKDKLDQNIIEKTILEISKLGLDTELEFKTIENKKYTFKVTYFSKPMETLNPVFIELLDKETSFSRKKEIGKVDQLQIFQWLRKITLTNSKIKINSSNSIWANVILKDIPRYIEYDICEFLK